MLDFNEHQKKAHETADYPEGKIMEQTKRKHSGIPMTPEEIAEWQKAFTDIEESVEALYESDKTVYNKGTNKPKRRKQV